MGSVDCPREGPAVDPENSSQHSGRAAWTTELWRVPATSYLLITVPRSPVFCSTSRLSWFNKSNTCFTEVAKRAPLSCADLKTIFSKTEALVLLRQLPALTWSGSHQAHPGASLRSGARAGGSFPYKTALRRVQR